MISNAEAREIANELRRGLAEVDAVQGLGHRERTPVMARAMNIIFHAVNGSRETILAALDDWDPLDHGELPHLVGAGRVHRAG